MTPQNSQNNVSNPHNRFQSNGSFPNRPLTTILKSNNQSNIEGLVSSFMASQNARLSMFEGDFKQQQSKMTNKIDTLLKAINDRMMGALPSDTLSVLEVLAHAPIYNTILDRYVESLEFGKNGYAFIQGEMPKKLNDPGLFTLPCRLGESKPFDALANFGSCVNLILLYLFKTLNVRIFEEIENVLGLADGTRSYPIGIVKNVEVHVGKLKLLENFYVIDMEKDPRFPLLVGRGFLATAGAIIDCKKAKITVGEGVTRSIFGVKKIGLGNIWESDDLIEKKIDWKKPPKEGDGAWHIRIEIIDPDGENFDRTFQSIPTTRKLCEKERPNDIIDLEHFHDT
ncbi:retrovirus-related pol polyprotein from transposon TNT 1-94 [Tanacetum coccineum]